MKTKHKVLRPVRPNAGIETAYARKLEALVDAMHRSVMWWVAKAYEKNVPRLQDLSKPAGDSAQAVMAMDADVALLLDRIIRRLTRYWNRKFAEAAVIAAQHFAQQNQQYTDSSFEQALLDSGFAIEFGVTPEVQTVLNSVIKENVALITNLSQKHMNEITGIVMRSVQKGGDTFELKTQLENKYHMTKRRARLIALDQNSKATAVITRTRQLQLGIRQAKWLHSHGARHPRPTHIQMDGQLYDISKGMWDADADGKGKGRYVFPGELINCGCVSRAIISKPL